LDERAAAYRGAAVSSTPWRASDKGLLPIALDDYLELLDWTGREVRSGKRGAIPEHLAAILERLAINADLWTEMASGFDRLFGSVVGSAQQVAAHAARMGRRWYQGVRQCRTAFG
jgi:hypothetical protein